MPALRWENVRIRIFQDGIDIGTIFATDLTVDEEFTDDKSKYQGRETPDGDASYNGGNGSITVERQGGSVNIENMLDRYRDGVKARNGTGKLMLQVTDVHPSGDVVVYRMSNCRPMAGKRGAQNTRLTTTIRFNFDDKQRVA